MSLEFRVKTLTPICLSSGLSLGVGQEDTQTDLDGHLPVFRGRTLKGLLTEEVATILPVLEKENGPWHDAAAELFGEPGLSTPAAISFSNGTLSSGYRAAASRWEHLVTEALTLTRHQTRIERESGIPQKGSLRGTRLARAGLTFHFPIREQRTLSDKALVLLASAAASLKRAGLHRNRGWGQIEASVWLDGADRTLDLVKGLKATNLTIHRAKSTLAPSKYNGSKVLRVDLTLTSPAVLARTGSEPSTVETHDFIPGTSLLGALAARWLTVNKVEDPAVDPIFRKLFLDGTTHYLNAYPVYKNQRCLPVPKSWLREKYKESPVKDMAHPDAEAKLDDKPVTSGFVWINRIDDGESEAHRYVTDIKTFLHHQRDRNLGRATKESGSLYSYQAITAGQTFRTHILCEDEELSKILGDLISRAPLSLGRSRSAGYGGNALVKVESEKANWSEYSQPEDLDECETLSVTLLSDYIGAKDGLTNPNTLVDELRQRLSISGDVKVRKFISTGLAGGYVGAWKMPRPTSSTLAAGSVIIFEIPLSDVDQEAMRVLERNGLGSRRAEGFGRLAFGWHGDNPEFQLKSVSYTSDDPSSAGTEEYTKAREDVTSYLLEKELRLSAYDTAGLARRAPSPSLLGRVRMRVRTAESGAEVHSFLEEIQYRKDHQGKRTGRIKEAGKNLKSCRVESKDLLTWLDEWAQGKPDWPTEVRQSLRKVGLPEDAHKGDWRFIKIFLDAFLESLRRKRKRGSEK